VFDKRLQLTCPFQIVVFAPLGTAGFVPHTHGASANVTIMFRLWLAHRALHQRPTVKGYATMSAAALTQINAVEIKGPERSDGVSGRAVASAPIESARPFDPDNPDQGTENSLALAFKSRESPVGDLVCARLCKL
jgi:hypothetical protein